ncbi:MAG: hypothetical protein ACREKH_12445, partial [Candidatus Rokuibacteriota bacterium]
VSVNLSGVGPGGEAGDSVELLEEAADDLVSLGRCAQPVELCHNLRQRPFHLTDHALGIELALRVEALLTFHEFFAVEIRQGMERGLWLRTRIGEES